MASTAAATPPMAPALLPNPCAYVHHRIVHFRGESAFEAMVTSPRIPLLIAGVYVVLVHVVPHGLDLISPGGRPCPGLGVVIPMWNLFFSVASLVGFLYCAPVLLRLMTPTDHGITGLAPKQDWRTGEWDMEPHVRGGLYTSLCYWNRNIFLDGPTGFWLVAFNLSKILELADTLFLVLKRKPVPFIHWYHHTSVMLFCWHAHVSSIGNGLGFAVMNMAVHSLMYFYYFICACGLGRVARPFASLVTLLQLIQMFAGMVLVVYTSFLYLFHPKGCDTTAASLAFGVAMYFSYIVLFIRFYLDRYGGKGARAAARERRLRADKLNP